MVVGDFEINELLVRDRINDIIIGIYIRAGQRAPTTTNNNNNNNNQKNMH